MAWICAFLISWSLLAFIGVLRGMFDLLPWGGNFLLHDVWLPVGYGLIALGIAKCFLGRTFKASTILAKMAWIGAFLIFWILWTFSVIIRLWTDAPWVENVLLHQDIWLSVGYFLIALGIAKRFLSRTPKADVAISAQWSCALAVCALLFGSCWRFRYEIHAVRSRTIVLNMLQPHIIDEMSRWQKTDGINWTSGIPGAYDLDAEDLDAKERLGEAGIVAVETVKGEGSSGEYHLVWLTVHGDFFYEHGYLYITSGELPDPSEFGGEVPQFLRLSENWFEFWK